MNDSNVTRQLRIGAVTANGVDLLTGQYTHPMGSGQLSSGSWRVFPDQSGGYTQGIGGYPERVWVHTGCTTNSTPQRGRGLLVKVVHEEYILSHTQAAGVLELAYSSIELYTRARSGYTADSLQLKQGSWSYL